MADPDGGIVIIFCSREAGKPVLHGVRDRPRPPEALALSGLEQDDFHNPNNWVFI